MNTVNARGPVVAAAEAAQGERDGYPPTCDLCHQVRPQILTPNGAGLCHDCLMDIRAAFTAEQWARLGT